MFNARLCAVHSPFVVFMEICFGTEQKYYLYYSSVRKGIFD